MYNKKCYNEYVLYILISLLLITNIFTFLYYDNQIKRYQNNILKDYITNSIESVLNTTQIYEILEMQYDQKTIEYSSFSNSLNNLILINNDILTKSSTLKINNKNKRIFDNFVNCINTVKNSFLDIKNGYDLNDPNSLNKGKTNLANIKNYCITIKEEIGKN